MLTSFRGQSTFECIRECAIPFQCITMIQMYVVKVLTNKNAEQKKFSNNKRGTNSNKAEDEPSTEQQRLIHCQRIALFVRFVFATCRCLNYTTQVENFKLTKSQLPIVVHVSVYTDSRSVFPGRWVTYFGAHCEIRPNVGHGTIDQCARSIT